jgi:hypothetical protein
MFDRVFGRNKASSGGKADTGAESSQNQLDLLNVRVTSSSLTVPFYFYQGD